MKTGTQTSETENHGRHSNPLATFLDEESSNAPATLIRSQTVTRRMSHSVSLFRKYLQDKSQQGKSNPTDVEVMKPQQKPRRGLLTPQAICSSLRPPSFLEQELLPGTSRSNGTPTAKNQASKPQLTIFYSGAINVSDDVPIDKAQAIMLLAHQSSSPNAISPTKPMAQGATPALSSSASLNLPSVFKLQTELTIARKNSLQRFLQSRRNRTLNKAPYPSVSVKFSPLPSPSNLSSFLACVSANPA